MKGKHMEKDVPTIEQVDTVISDPNICGSENGKERMVAKILIFSAYVGEDEVQLSILSGLPLEAVKRISAMLKKNGVFGAGIDHHADYLENESSGVVLNCDIACGTNHLKRSVKDGEAAWKMTDEGLSYVEEKLLPKPEAQAMFDRIDKADGKKPGAWRKSWKGKKKW